jgi:hypothetical protein
MNLSISALYKKSFGSWYALELDGKNIPGWWLREEDDHYRLKCGYGQMVLVYRGTFEEACAILMAQYAVGADV